MCGICGIFRAQERGPWEDHNLAGMNAVLAHRGPDDEGYYYGGQIAFAHRRLSIIDLSGGAQPMTNEDKTIWIVFNGEIYNHLEIRKMMESKGHVYRTRSDTESIIHLYEEVGVKCLEYLHGMFAFAIWDKGKKQLFAARDRLGKKPLYYFQKNGCFVFASEIKALLKHPLCPREMDEDSLYHYLTFVFTPPPKTLFLGIGKLPPAHYFVMKDPAEPIHPIRYWNPLEKARSIRDGITEEGAAQTVRDLLCEAVKARMISDVPFGVFLSGGLDSSTNVSLMSRLMGQPVQTFSVGYEKDEEFNELSYARRVAELFGTNHKEIIISEEDLENSIRTIIYNQDEPIADPVCLPLYFVSKLARENGVIVVQIGEGSDEVFCGYPRYMKVLRLATLNRRILQKVPRGVRDLAYVLGAPLFHRLQRTKELEYLRRGLKSEEIFWGGAVAFGEVEKALLLTERVYKTNGHRDSYEVLEPIYDDFYRNFKTGEELDKIIYIDLMLRLPELLLMRVDKMCMAASVEARTPFLDHQLVEYALAIPPHLKIKDGVTKGILKKAVKGIIPDDIISRKKQGFDVPVGAWIRRGKNNFFLEALMDSELRKRGVFEYRYVESLMRLHLEGKRDYGFLLWNLFNLSVWYDQWIAGR